MTITAKHPGKCSVCHGPIVKGDSIEWRRGSKIVRHTSCVSPAPTAERSGNAELDQAATEILGQPIEKFAELVGRICERANELKAQNAIAAALATNGNEEAVPRDRNPYAGDGTVKMVSTRQLELVGDLGGDTHHAHKLTYDEASTFINGLLDSLPGEDVVPAARYALEIDGELCFVKVWRKGGRVNVYDDNTNAKLALGILRLIEAAGPFDCAQRYGQLRKSCSRCGIKLRNRLSVELSMGPQCIKYWHDDMKRLDLIDDARRAIRARGEDPNETL